MNPHPLKPLKKISLIFLIACALAAIVLLIYKSKTVPSSQISGTQASESSNSNAQVPTELPRLSTSFEEILAAYRKVIVLLADENTLGPKELYAANQVGQGLFHDNQARIDATTSQLETLIASKDPQRFATVSGLLDYVESGDGLFDADRLAFRELLQSMQIAIAKDGTLPAIKLHKRLGEDLEALDEIEHNYEKEISQIFGRFDQRAITLKREKWADYVAKLKTLYNSEQILKDYGVIVPYSTPKPGTTDEADAKKAQIFGTELPPKTIALTFDDGPHPIYTEEIEAILKQYDVPAVFFNVGRNLGSISTDGKIKLSPLGALSRKLITDGFVVGNHSFTHAQLAKESGDTLKAEILNTDTLLKAVSPDRSMLFRFPYGASNSEGLQDLESAHLKSVLWNIDSLDWADPIPSSVADRVLQAVKKEGHGIILFHDIHERAVKALPTILDQLVADGYQFAGWDGTGFSVSKTAATPDKTPITSGYSDSWAIVIGIDDYAKWPKLQYAANDAQSVRQTLIEKFGFASDHVFSLQNGEATRNGILATFHDRLGDVVKKNDRIFVFFAGHGATRKLSSGRDLGYLIPVDSDPNEFATDAIPMTDIQNIAESLTAKHVLFVMDACYSGLGLTRGGGSSSFLRDNAKRIGRQMLTAGGADQMVADGGPNGHSIFTWTLLQGLAGKGDLNGDGLITATELAAYVAPAVASVSQQTPAFGSLPGSEGGEFVFELPTENEFIDTQTTQLSSEAIALNSKLDSNQPTVTAVDKPSSAPTAVIVKDLQGGDHKIALPPPVASSVKQLAQRANDRGLQFYKEKQYDLAEAEFTEALKLRPGFALAANNLGYVFYKQGKFQEAARWFENTIKMDISRAIAYVNLGDAYLNASNNDKAKQAYQTYLELQPSGNRADYVKQQLEKL